MMIINTEPKIDGYNALSQQMSSDKTLPFALKADPTILDEGESESRRERGAVGEDVDSLKG